MKKEWQTKKLGEVCAIVGGGTPAKDNTAFYTGQIPWATVRDMRQDVLTETEFKITEEAVKRSSTNIIPAGNVIIATRVGLGKVCLIKQDTAINQDLRGIIPLNKDVLLVRFLYWWFKDISEVIIDAGTGATVQGVKLPFIKSLTIPLPPLPEQRRIVALLDEAFARLAIAEANAAQNLQNARALFESHLHQTFSHPSPEWVEKKLGEVCEFKPPKNEARNKISPDSFVSFMPMEDLKVNVKFPEAQKNKMLSEVIGGYTYFADGDVLLAKITPCFENGKLGIANALTNGIGFGSSEFIVIRPREGLLNEWLYYFLSQESFRQEGAQRMGGAVGHKRLPQNFVEKFPIPLPPFPEQRRIVAQLDALSAEVRKLEELYTRKQTLLAELKRSLLHHAFNGNL